MALLKVASARFWVRVLGRPAAALVAACALFAPLSTEAAEPRSRLLDVQAVFLVNLTRFVRWPESSFGAPDAPFILGVAAGDPIAPVLEEVAHDEKSGAHPLVVHLIKSAKDAEECHLVYFSQNTFENGAQIIATLRDKPVLTVSDASAFLHLGGQVQFYQRNGQIKLRINLPALQRVNLIPSAPLLRVADIVDK